MKIAAMFSLKRGQAIIEERFGAELAEVRAVVERVDSTLYRTKISSERTMRGRLLYRPKALNSAFKSGFEGYGWQSRKVLCDYSTDEFLPEFQAAQPTRGAFREMDFVKNRVGVEVQFGKYAFMVYNVCAKMTIFNRLNFIDVGIEIVPIKRFVESMSSEVSYFEQFVWDLKNRGEADIDIPVLILGITE